MKVQVGTRKKSLTIMPVTLIGANVNGKPNYTTVAYTGIVAKDCISIGMSKTHYGNIGIKENKTFSVNIPSIEMVSQTDYCGMVSGKDVDKSVVFDTFYGILKTAPMINECPINLECKLLQVVDLPKGEVFIGEIIEAYVSDKYIVEDKVDFSRVQPILFTTEERKYWKLGDRFANAFKIKEKPEI
ncbi:MAG: flavin reductase family protein [Chloroflexi bacterium]|nr:flavin reductase family protein [Chloroflexota bacterium]